MQKEKFSKFLNFIYYILLVIIICFGLFLRLKQYFSAYPLWNDELWIYINITFNSFAHCFQVLENFQMAPPLWQCLNKLIGILFGNDNVLIVRLVSILSGCISLFLFQILLNKTFKSKISILVGMLLFSISGPLVYYSADFKQYIFDLFIFISLALVYDKISFLQTKKFIFWLIIFFILPFFSFTSLIVLGAILISKTIDLFSSSDLNLKQKMLNCLKILSGGVILLIPACILYKINFQNVGGMQNSWHIPLFDQVLNYFDYLDLSGGVSIILFFISFILIFFSNNRILRLFLIIFLLQIFASFIHLYPFLERMSLFIVPVFIFFIVYIFEIEDKFKIDKLYIARSLALIILLFNSINIIGNINAVMDKEFNRATLQLYERKQLVNQVINFLNLYKNGDKYISTMTIEPYIIYYNKNLKYNYDLNGIVSLNNIQSSIEELSNNINYNYWIFRDALFYEVTYDDNVRGDYDLDFYLKYQDIEKIIKESGRKYKIIETNSGNIYYVEKQMSK